MKLSADYSLLGHNTFAIEAKARLFVEYGSLEELRLVINERIIPDGERCMHVGMGSNLLFVNDFDGIILHSLMKGVEAVEETDTHVRVRVENGVVWDDFCAAMAAKGYWGVENLSYIPGEVGACAVQNIGAYGVEFADVVERLEVVSLINGELFPMGVEECRYGYRDSIFKHTDGDKLIVVAATFLLSKEPKRNLQYGNLSSHISENASISEVRDGVIATRRSKLPEVGVLGSAGSFFKNPVVAPEVFEALKTQYPTIPSYKTDDDMVKIPAAWLIDNCGLKGKSVGAAQVYEKQPLVIVNNGGATARDVVELAEFVVKSVNEKFGIALEREVIYVE